MRKWSSRVLAVVAVIMLIGASLMKPEGYREITWYHAEPIASPEEMALVMFAVFLLSLAMVLRQKEIRAAAGRFFGSMQLQRSACCNAPFNSVGRCFRCGEESEVTYVDKDTC